MCRVGIIHPQEVDEPFGAFWDADFAAITTAAEHLDMANQMEYMYRSFVTVWRRRSAAAADAADGPSSAKNRSEYGWCTLEVAQAARRLGDASPARCAPAARRQSWGCRSGPSQIRWMDT